MFLARAGSGWFRLVPAGSCKELVVVCLPGVPSYSSPKTTGLNQSQDPQPIVSICSILNPLLLIITQLNPRFLVATSPPKH